MVAFAPPKLTAPQTPTDQQPKDSRLPASEIPAFVAGYVGVLIDLASGKDPLTTLKSSMTKAILAAGGVSDIRQQLMRAALAPSSPETPVTNELPRMMEPKT